MTFTRKNDSNYPTMLLSLLAGAGAGLVVGAMMAPKSGSKLRAQIGEAVDDYLDSAKDKVGDIRNSAANLAQRGMREVRNKMGDTVDCAVDAGVGSAHDAIHRAADTMHSGVQTGAKKGHEAVDQAADAVRSTVR